MDQEVTEICLLWGDLQIQRWWSCMKKDEWASWAQAVGVLLTISMPFLFSAIKRLRARNILIGMKAYIVGAVDRLRIAEELASAEKADSKSRLLQIIRVLEDIRDPYNEELEAMSLYSPSLGIRLQDLMRVNKIALKRVNEIMQLNEKFASDIVFNHNATFISMELAIMAKEWDGFFKKFDRIINK